MSNPGVKDDNVHVIDDPKSPGWTQDPLEITAPSKAPNIEIEVVDDAPPADRGRPPRDPKAPTYEVKDEDLAKYSEKAQDRIKRLRYEYHEERRQKEQAARERDEAIRVAQHWHQTSQQALQAAQAKQAEFLEQSRARGEGEIQMAQRALAAALESGKSDEIAKAQTDLTRVIARQTNLPDKPVAPVQQAAPVQPQQQPQWQQPQQQAPVAQQTAPDPRAVKWLKDNQWFGTDKKMTGYAYGVHEELVTEKGLDPVRDADEYYEEVNAAMRKAFPEEFGADPEKERVAQRPNIVAPPARGTGPRKVQLTASQAAVAKRLGITLQQYAEQLVKEQKANG